jgi:hypothetical protein
MMTRASTSTTLTRSHDLLEQFDLAMRGGTARSRNALITSALLRHLAAIEAAEIDAAFAGMSDDTKYQAETDELARAFAEADWETFRLSEPEQ